MVVGAVITTALAAGLYAAFAYAVMPGLAQSGGQHAVAAMRAINVAIINPVFAVIFLGPLIFGGLAVWLSWQDALRWWAVAACALYLLSLLITVAINVPLNNRLADAGQGAAEMAAGWRDYYVPWVRWNAVRAIIAAAALTTWIVGLIGAR